MVAAIKKPTLEELLQGDELTAKPSREDLLQGDIDKLSQQLTFRTTPSGALHNDPNDAYFGLTDPNDTEKRAKDVLDIADRLDLSIPETEKNYHTLANVAPSVIKGEPYIEDERDRMPTLEERLAGLQIINIADPKDITIGNSFVELVDKISQERYESQRRNYKNFWDELMFQVGGGMVRLGAGGLATLSTVSESAVWDKETIEDAAQFLYELGQRPELATAKGAGWKGYVATATGQAMPYMGAAALATATSGTSLGAFGVAFVAEGGGAYLTTLKHGGSDEEARMNMFIVGTINGTLEKMQIDELWRFAKTGNATRKAVLKNATKKSWQKILKSGKELSYDYLRLITTEATQESLQELTSIVVESELNPEVWSQATDRIFQAGLGGATVAGILGFGGRVGSLALSDKTDAIVSEYNVKIKVAQNKGDTEAVRSLRALEQNELSQLEGIPDQPIEEKPAGTVTPPTKAIPTPEKPVAGRKAEIAPATQPEAVSIEKGISISRAEQLTGKKQPSAAEIRDSFNKIERSEQEIVIRNIEGELQELKDEKKSLLQQRREAFVPDKPLFTKRIKSAEKQIEGKITRLDKLKALAPTAKPEAMTAEEFSQFEIPLVKDEGKFPQITRIKDILAKEGIKIEEIGVTGSHAMGVATPESDVDVYVKVSKTDFQRADDLLAPLSKEKIDALVNWRGVGKEGGILRGQKTHKRLIEKAKAKKKPVIPPISKETKDILGGVDPIQTIHRALAEAKAVRPITEAAKKEALRKRVGAAVGVLKTELTKGTPAEQAIQLSTGMLKGPLTEYTQLYESIEDILDPEVKNSARLMITRHPDLRYFEIINTDKSFTKLIQGSSLTPNEAAQIERVFGKAFEEQLAKVTTKSDLYERLIATWKAGLLTGMKTSGLNILSTASHAVSETAKDVPAALVDSGVALVTGERTVAFTARGYGFGFKQGLGKGWSYMKTGYDERNVLAKYDYKKTNFGTSKIAKAQQAYVEFIFHLLGAEDQPFYYGALSRSLYSQAIAQAKNKGLKGKERQAFVDNLQKNPTDEMLEWAKEDAETAIYTNRTHLGDVAKSIQKVKGGEIVVPFGRTPSAVAMQIINYSPVGVVKEISHQIHKGTFNQRKFSQAAGRTVVGTAAMYLGVQLFKAGLIALGFPKSERERKLWELEGKKPNSILIDDKWRGVETFGPLGNLLVIGGYFQQALDSKGSPTEAMIEAMAGGAKSFTEQTFVRGVNLAVDALTDPEASFERWFTSMSGSLVPTIVADIARAQDDRARRAVGPKERIQSRIPIYRRGLPPKIDVFGQDLPRYGGNVLETMVDPTRPSKIRQDVVVDELRRLWDKDIKVSPTLLGDRAGFDILTKEENTQLWQRAGELTYKALFGLVNTDNYSKANDFVKGQLVEFITRQAKSAAKAEIVNIKLKQGKTILKLAESGLLSIDSLEALKYFQENPTGK